MPFIPEDMRKIADEIGPVTGGELSYVLLKTVRQYIASRADTANYNAYADVVAALEVTKFIFQDEDLRKYEAVKRHQNGDV